MTIVTNEKCDCAAASDGPFKDVHSKSCAIFGREWDDEDIRNLRRMIPDIDAVCTFNPISNVYFRAGLLACREYMARFVEQGGDTATAQSHFSFVTMVIKSPLESLLLPLETVSRKIPL